jgi:hypothetical protein
MSGAEEITGQFGNDDSSTQSIFLDDVGCSGSEMNLLNCLPYHNCKIGENAGVKCLRKGIT